MPSDLIYETKVKHKGLFDFKDMYNLMYDWFDDNKYDVEEKAYTEKVAPKGKELEIKWECKKKITDYFRFKIKITIRVLGLTDVEVQSGKKKIKTNQGQIELKVSAYLDKDYEERWETTPFNVFLRGVYERYIIKTRVKEYENKLTDEAINLVNNVKSFLMLEAKA